ncbi:MAG: hypothetical protein M3Z13_04655 [Candidatus Dormibacteraeota bacterium]|nr:hypothetical protein [Candidatus Dormibacteraeota bacterium]
MNRFKVAIAGGVVAASMFTGGVLGATLLGSGAIAASAATPAPTTTAPQAAPAGGFRSNEDATHEAGESAAREAQENAGQAPSVP